MEFKARYNKRDIMYNAHKFYRDGRHGDFANCLRHAWENAKGVKRLADALGEEIHTWKGWTALGREVIHEQKTVGQVDSWVTHLKYKIKMAMSYFTYEQTCELGTQPPKA